MTRSFILFFPSLLIAAAAMGQPDWVQQRPIVPGHYVGVGTAPVAGPGTDYLEAAKNAALADLASEISVSIESSFMRSILETSDSFADSVQSELKAKATNDLEGYELVDTWTSDHAHWVYYLLSRDEHARRVAARRAQASERSLDLYMRGRGFEERSQVAPALGAYVQALHAAGEFLGQPLEAFVDGRSVFLTNEVHGALSSLLASIELDVEVPRIAATRGRTKDVPLNVRVVSSRGTPLDQIPLRYGFVTGSGELLTRISSDTEGWARGQLMSVRGEAPVQLVEASVDLEPLVGVDTVDVVLKSVLAGISRPRASIRLDVSAPILFLRSQELNMGREADVAFVAPTVKETLAEAGYAFSEDPSGAHAVIDVHVETRSGGEVAGMHSAFADATVTMTDADGAEIFAASLKGIRGLQLDPASAGKEALERAADEIRLRLAEAVPQQFH